MVVLLTLLVIIILMVSDRGGDLGGVCSWL